MAEGYQVLEELGSACIQPRCCSALLTAHRRKLRKGVQGHRKGHGRDGSYQAGTSHHPCLQTYAHLFHQIDLEESTDELADIQAEINLLGTCKSPYVTEYKTSFVRGVKLWIVMEFLGGGSALDLVWKPNQTCT